MEIKLTEIKLMENCKSCPVEFAINTIGGKWKILIVYQLLQNDKIRFNELQRALSTVTHRTLTRQLRELEADGLIHRVAYAEMPPRVEYFVTDKGKSLTPILLQLQEWGLQNM